MNIAFQTLDDRAGMEVVDRIDQYHYRLHTSGDVSPTPAATDQFRFPVGSAVSITTSAIVLPTVVPVYVRDGDGTMVAEVKHLGEASPPTRTVWSYVPGSRRISGLRRNSRSPRTPSGAKSSSAPRPNSGSGLALDTSNRRRRSPRATIPST